MIPSFSRNTMQCAHQAVSGQTAHIELVHVALIRYPLDLVVLRTQSRVQRLIPLRFGKLIATDSLFVDMKVQTHINTFVLFPAHLLTSVRKDKTLNQGEEEVFGVPVEAFCQHIVPSDTLVDVDNHAT